MSDDQTTLGDLEIADEAVRAWLEGLGDGHASLMARVIGTALTGPNGESLRGAEVSRLVMHVGLMVAARYAHVLQGTGGKPISQTTLGEILQAYRERAAGGPNPVVGALG